MRGVTEDGKDLSNREAGGVRDETRLARGGSSTDENLKAIGWVACLWDHWLFNKAGEEDFGSGCLDR